MTAGDAFKFRHILIRDAAYEALPKAERAVLHERFADWLEATAGDRLTELEEIVGYHLEQAHRYRIELRDDDRAATDLLAARALQHIVPAGKAGAGAKESPCRRLIGAPRGRPLSGGDVSESNCLSTFGGRSGWPVSETPRMWSTRRSQPSSRSCPDEGLEHHRWQAEVFFTLDATIPEAQAAYEYYERIGDPLGMLRALQIGFIANAGQGELAAALETVDKANALALEIGRPDRAAAFNADLQSANFWDSPMSIPDGIDRCWRYLAMAGDNRVSRVMILLALGCLEASSGVEDRWRRHFDAARRSSSMTSAS